MVSKWSAEVTQHSDALDLEKDVFKSKDPKRIAASLQRSARASSRRKADPFRSAMSMLTFYIKSSREKSHPIAKEDAGGCER